MMFARRKRKVPASRTPIAMVERLDIRRIVDAPLALASDGLLLAGPDPLEREEPVLFAEADAGGSSDATSPTPVSPHPELDPADDPLSPVGDPEGGAVVAGGAPPACCGSPITYTVTVDTMATADEARPLDKGRFRFTATASCSAGAPSSITVGYNRDGSTALSPDYEGDITADSVIIPLLNGTGSKEVEFSVKHDVIDEVTEFVKVTIPRTTVINPLPDPPPDPLPPPVTDSAAISDDDIEWAAGDPIEGTIGFDAVGDTPAVPINGTLGLWIEAFDRDRMKDNGVWTDFYDDVTSGNTLENHHVKWTASEGKFIQNGVEMDTAYGTEATYLAPDYAEAQLSRTVTITATVDDFNRGDDTLGFNDQAKLVQQQAKVWQVSIEVKMQGKLSDFPYDGPGLPDEAGGTKLGWIRPGDPEGCQWYGGNALLTGTVGEGGPQTGLTWVNDKKQTISFLKDGEWEVIANDLEYVEDFKAPTYQWADLDTRSPNGPEGNNNDTRKIFAFDSAAYPMGADNNLHIGPPDNWTGFAWDVRFKCYVKEGDRIVSKAEGVAWRVTFSLTVENGVWKDVLHEP